LFVGHCHGDIHCEEQAERVLQSHFTMKLEEILDDVYLAVVLLIIAQLVQLFFLWSKITYHKIFVAFCLLATFSKIFVANFSSRWHSIFFACSGF
jgi:hypothetical protein